MTEQSIIKVSGREIKMADLTAEDLAKPEVAQAVVAAMHTANDAAKEAKKANDALVSGMKAISAGMELADGQTLTVYDWEGGHKVSTSFSHRGEEVDAKKLLASIYEACGEEPGDKTGRAWRAWVEITDPVESRQLNEAKLVEYIKKGECIADGVQKGTVAFGKEELAAATNPAALVQSVRVASITKDEKKRHAEQDWSPACEVQSK